MTKAHVGWWQATGRNVYVKFGEVESYAVRFVQAPGGGAPSDPARAWLNEIKVLNKKWQEVKFWYDALGRRIGKRVISPSQGLDSLTRWLYDGQQILEEKLGGQFAGVSVSEFKAKEWVYGTGIDEPIEMVLSPIAVGPPDPALPPDQPANLFWPNAPWGGTFTYHTNSLGSVTALTNEAGQVVERYSYTVYGEVTFKDGWGTELIDPLTQEPARRSLVGNCYLFTARDWDSALQLYHYRARAYSASGGRFLQKDPLESHAKSRYAYVSNRPTAARDPLGLFGLYYHDEMMKAAFESTFSDDTILALRVYNWEADIMNNWTKYAHELRKVAAGVDVLVKLLPALLESFKHGAQPGLQVPIEDPANGISIEKMYYEGLHFVDLLTGGEVHGAVKDWGGKFEMLAEAGKPKIPDMGNLFHQMEDFYAHSNWAELMSDNNPKATAADVVTLEQVFPCWEVGLANPPTGLRTAAARKGAEVSEEFTHERMHRDYPAADRPFFALAYNLAGRSSKFWAKRWAHILQKKNHAGYLELTNRWSASERNALQAKYDLYKQLAKTAGQWHGPK